MIFQDHVAKGSSDFMGNSPSIRVSLLLGLVAIKTGSEDITVIVCQVI